MFTEKIDPNRALFLAKTSEGWVLAKVGKFDMVSNDDLTLNHYEICHSLFDMALIPQEEIDRMIGYLPKEWTKEWADKHQPKILNYFD